MSPGEPPHAETSVSPLSSIELRWFGRCDDAGDPGAPEGVLRETSDRYAPTGEDCGIKLREGRVEVKYRTPLPGAPVELRSGRRFEAWCKWMLPVPAATRTACARWITVEKARALRFEQFGGCDLQIEHSRVAVNGQGWWTIGVEITGALSMIGDRRLLSCIDAALAPYTAALTHGVCCGYPAWLQRFQPEETTV